MKLGIILTPDNRSKAYIQKLVENNIMLNSILFMNDNRREKPYSDDIIKISKKNGFDITKSVKDIFTENNEPDRNIRYFQYSYEMYVVLHTHHHCNILHPVYYKFRR